mmetsp:Transcript_29715/g.96824  ORF Transcript_29715/g.96824 Transcript_29715/m.96824 type:complete len:215 (-) Transcript_29715:1057-1701(-)
MTRDACEAAFCAKTRFLPDLAAISAANEAGVRPGGSAQSPCSRRHRIESSTAAPSSYASNAGSPSSASSSPGTKTTRRTSAPVARIRIERSVGRRSSLRVANSTPPPVLITGVRPRASASTTRHIENTPRSPLSRIVVSSPTPSSSPSMWTQRSQPTASHSAAAHVLLPYPIGPSTTHTVTCGRPSSSALKSLIASSAPGASAERSRATCVSAN